VAKPVAKETDHVLVAVQAARDAAAFQRGKVEEFRERLASVNDRDLKSYYRAKVGEANRKANECDAEASRLLAEHIERMSSTIDVRPGETPEDARKREARDAEFKRMHRDL
jgi:hypothetical protein